MIVFWIILFVLFVFVILFRMMIKGFKNPERKHEKTPGDEGIDFEEIHIKTGNNRSLYGWWIFKKKEYPTIILVHGWGRNVERMMPYIVKLNHQRFNLLAFDSRNHGNSDKEKHSTMKKFAEDISASVDFISSRNNPAKPEIGVVGLSIGGAAAIYASAHDKRIKSIITVGTFANPVDVMKLQLSKRRIPYFPMGWLLMNYLQLILGFKFKDIAPENHIANTNAKILLIHGREDVTTPLSHAKRLEMKSNHYLVELWSIPGKGHSNCHLADGFWERITRFFTRSLS